MRDTNYKHCNYFVKKYIECKNSKNKSHEDYKECIKYFKMLKWCTYILY